MTEQTELKGSDTVVITGPGGVHDLMFPHDEEADLGFHEVLERRALQREIKPTVLLRTIAAHTGREIRFTGDPNQPIEIPDNGARALRSLGQILLEASALRQRVVMPASGEEMQNFATGVVTASLTGEPIPLYTPCCPDWSQDMNGRYDYKSLGGGPSAIAGKFFDEAPPLLHALRAQGIAYEPTIVIADWGLETDIEAYDRDGRLLTPDEVSARFQSTAEHAVAQVEALQEETDVFDTTRVVLMSEFFLAQGIDPSATYEDARVLFESHAKGKKLVNELHNASLPINKQRRGLSEEANRAQAVQNLAEYATFSGALPDNGIIFAAESQTTTKAYNTFRPRTEGYLKDASAPVLHTRE